MDIKNRALWYGSQARAQIDALSKMVVKKIKRPISGSGSGTPTPPRPFDIILVPDPMPATTIALSLIPGSINQLLPSNMLSTYSIQNNLNYIVYLAVVTDGKKVLSSTVNVSGSIPAQGIDTTQAVPPTSFNIVIGTVVSGSLNQMNHGNINATPSLMLLTDRNPPVPGLSVTIKWYTWALAFVFPA